MRPDDLCSRSAASGPVGMAEATALLASRAMSAVELVRAQLDRFTTLDGQLNAFLLVTAGQALAQAKRTDGALATGESLRALAGIPIGSKGIICTQGVRTTGHSRTLAYAVPSENATTRRWNEFITS